MLLGGRGDEEDDDDDDNNNSSTASGKIKMWPWNCPHTVDPVMTFQDATRNNLMLEDHNIESRQGGLTKDGKICWVYQGSVLEVVGAVTRHRLAAYNFSAITKSMDSVITYVIEFWDNNSLKLLVGLKNSATSGMLCFFDVSISRVVKAIEIPFPITSLELVSSMFGDNIPVWAFSEHLCCFYGIVAVGTEGGHIYLIDMSLDVNNQLNDELVIKNLSYMSPTIKDAVQLRHEALSQGEVLCMELDEDNYSFGSYNYQSCDESLLRQFKTDDVFVSCLKYIHRNGMLAVGFNFGSFQLWRLSTPILMYSSPLESVFVPVTHIAYQEPENDPKNFTYMWVARGPPLSYTEKSCLSSLTLYQLAFKKRIWYSSTEAFYEDLSVITLRIDHDLTSDPMNTAENEGTFSSHVISCYTLEDPFCSPAVKLKEDDSSEESAVNPDLSLCMFVWKAIDGHASGSSCYFLGLFDMNRWYFAQMPSTVRCYGSSSGVCPYFAFCKLNDVLDVAIAGGERAESFLNVCVNTKSLRKFISDAVFPPEQHFYPSSLTFDVICLIESGIVKARYLGTQRQILANMQKIGPSFLINPNDMYKMASYAGLVSRPGEMAIHTLNFTAYQRESLLTVCLENHLLNLIIRCIVEWADGEYVHHGCSLKFLLDWTWSKIMLIKHTIDNTCKPFYDWSGLQVDDRCLQCLHSCYQKLGHLMKILQMFISHAGPVTEKGLLELDQKLNSVVLLSQYLKVVIWFVESGLLPENDEAADDFPGLYKYPANTLIQAFDNRRQELKRLHSDMKITNVLLIDELIKQAGPSVQTVWEQDSRDGVYPPPSLHALLNIYLLDSVTALTKHCILLYLLLDLVSLEDEDGNMKLSEKVATFAHVFSVPAGTVRLITGFWLLDHQDFQGAISFLTSSPDLGSWQHKQIIKAFLYQEESKLALRYLAIKNPPLTTPDEVKLKLTVFLANRMTAQAVEFQRNCRDQENAQDLISHLFLGCQQMKTMSQLVQLPLSSLEEKWLESYLMDSSHPHSQELLVMYYLQRSRFVDAIRLNEKLKHRLLGESSRKARDRASTRNAIVHGCARLLPPVQQQLIFERTHLPKKTAVSKLEVPRPKPLSTVVTQSKASRVMSQSALILTVMEKLQELAHIDANRSTYEEDEDEKEVQIEPFISTPITPRKRSRFSNIPKVVYGRVNENEQLSLSRHKDLGSSPLYGKLTEPYKSVPRRSTKYVSAEALSLLQTPTLSRKSTPRTKLPSPKPTPQSILKVRRISARSPIPLAVSRSSLEQMPDDQISPDASVNRDNKSQLNFSDSFPKSPVSTQETTTTTKLLRFVEPYPHRASPSPANLTHLPLPSTSSASKQFQKKASPPKSFQTAENLKELLMDEEMAEISPAAPFHWQREQVVDEEITFSIRPQPPDIEPMDVVDLTEPDLDNEDESSPKTDKICPLTGDEDEAEDHKNVEMEDGGGDVLQIKDREEEEEEHLLLPSEETPLVIDVGEHKPLAVMVPDEKDLKESSEPPSPLESPTKHSDSQSVSPVRRSPRIKARISVEAGVMPMMTPEPSTPPPDSDALNHPAERLAMTQLTPSSSPQSSVPSVLETMPLSEIPANPQQEEQMPSSAATSSAQKLRMSKSVPSTHDKASGRKKLHSGLFHHKAELDGQNRSDDIQAEETQHLSLLTQRTSGEQSLTPSRPTKPAEERLSPSEEKGPGLTKKSVQRKIMEEDDVEPDEKMLSDKQTSYIRVTRSHGDSVTPPRAITPVRHKHLHLPGMGTAKKENSSQPPMQDKPTTPTRRSARLQNKDGPVKTSSPVEVTEKKRVSPDNTSGAECFKFSDPVPVGTPTDDKLMDREATAVMEVFAFSPPLLHSEVSGDEKKPENLFIFAPSLRRSKTGRQESRRDEQEEMSLTHQPRLLPESEPWMASLPKPTPKSKTRKKKNVNPLHYLSPDASIINLFSPLTTLKEPTPSSSSLKSRRTLRKSSQHTMTLRTHRGAATKKRRL